MGNSSMRCSQDLLDALHARKERGDSYEDVVWRLLEAETASPDAAAYRDVAERPFLNGEQYRPGSDSGGSVMHGQLTGPSPN